MSAAIYIAGIMSGLLLISINTLPGSSCIVLTGIKKSLHMINTPISYSTISHLSCSVSSLVCFTTCSCRTVNAPTPATSLKHLFSLSLPSLLMLESSLQTPEIEPLR